MDPVRATTLPGAATAASVHERQAGGRRGDPGAFSRAMQEQGGRQADGQRQEDAPPAVRSPHRPLATALQRRAAFGRKDPGVPAVHVDVIA